MTAPLFWARSHYWDRFDHDHVAFWLWTGLYVITPLARAACLVAHRQTDPGTLESAGEDRYLPEGVRSVLKVAGLAQFAIAAVLLAFPSTMVDIWPWGSPDHAGRPGRSPLAQARCSPLGASTHQ